MCVCATGNDCGGLTCGEGPAGADGLNSFTVTTAQFTVPAINSNVSINVSALGQATGIWALVGEEIFIETAGYYRVVSATTTVIVATNTGTTGNANAATVIAIGSGVGPGGRQGVAGATGATGSAGADGTTAIFTRASTTLVTATTYTALHSTITLPANFFSAAFDTLRLRITGVGNAGGTTTTTANFMRYRFQVFIGATAVGPSFTCTSRLSASGVDIKMDLVVLSLSPFTIAVYVPDYVIGASSYSTTNGFLVLGNGVRLATGNLFASGYYLGIDPTISNTISIQGRVETVGTGGNVGTAGMYLPYANGELLKP